MERPAGWLRGRQKAWPRGLRLRRVLGEVEVRLGGKEKGKGALLACRSRVGALGELG